MQIHCNFVTMIGLTNDERYVEKNWGSIKIMKMFSYK